MITFVIFTSYTFISLNRFIYIFHEKKRDTNIMRSLFIALKTYEHKAIMTTCNAIYNFHSVDQPSMPSVLNISNSLQKY